MISPSSSLPEESLAHVFSHLLLTHTQCETLDSFLDILLYTPRADSGPPFKEHLSPLPSPPMVPSQFRWYKAYDGRSKSQPKPGAVNRFQETDWNSSGHWRRVTLQLSSATEPRGPGSSDTEARVHPKSKVSTQNAWESSKPQFPYQ